MERKPEADMPAMRGQSNQVKYVVILGDGMGDRPVPSLGNKTPLEAARKPNMDRFAREGLCGVTRTLRDGLPTGSDVANLSVLGYKPELYYTGRSPIEALGLGLDVGESDMVFRANLVHLGPGETLSDCEMIDHSSDKITDGEAAELVGALRAILPPYIDLYPGASYRNIALWRNFTETFAGTPVLTPPHDILEQSCAAYLPSGAASAELLELTEKSRALLEAHPVNAARREKGLRTANCLWFWGEGTKPRLANFSERYGVKGVMVTAVPLLEGLAAGMGMERARVEGVTGDIHTNYEGKANAAVDALKAGADFVFVHVEAADECGHDGQADEKTRAIEYIDERVIGTILSRLSELEGEVRFLLLPDHATPVALRTHSTDDIPFAVYSTARELGPHAAGYDEKSAAATGYDVKNGYDLMRLFLSL